MNRALDTLAPVLFCLLLALGAALPDLYRWIRGPEKPCTLSVTDAGEVYWCNRWRGTYAHLRRPAERYTVTIVAQERGE